MYESGELAEAVGVEQPAGEAPPVAEAAQPAGPAPLSVENRLS